MRLGILLATALLGAGMAQAQVVSPLGGSTGNPQSPPAGTRAPAARIAPAAPAPSTASPAPATTPATTGSTAPRHRRTLDERFTAANATHDGKLTLEQARTGRLRAVARDFDQIDTGKRGYVTLEEIKAHQSAQRAARRAARTQSRSQAAPAPAPAAAPAPR